MRKNRQNLLIFAYISNIIANKFANIDQKHYICIEKSLIFFNYG